MQPVGEICNQYGNFSYSSLRAGPVRCKHRLVTDRQSPTVVRLFGTSDGFPHENWGGAKTKTDFWTGPTPISSQCRWLQMPHLQKSGSYLKKLTFGQKSGFLGPKKKDHFLRLTIFWPSPGKVVKTKKYPFPK